MSLKNKETSRGGGPRSAEGKAIAAQNSRKHGILSTKIKPADNEAVQSLFAQITTEFRVTSNSRSYLARELAFTLFKLEHLKSIQHQAVAQTHEAKLDGSADTEYATITEKLQVIWGRYEPMLVKRMLLLMKELRESMPSGDEVNEDESIKNEDKDNDQLELDDLIPDESDDAKKED